jgi:3-dehydroquinate dehydratase type I
MICIPITAHTQAEALCEIEKNIHLADVLELRMDLIQDANLPALIAKCRAFDLPPKIIVTNRKKTEGGGLPDRHTEGNISPGEERQRVDVLKDAVKYDVDYVDIELSADHVLIAELISAIHKHGDKTKLIISHHDFQAPPSIR